MSTMLTGVVRGCPRPWQEVGWVALLAGLLWAAMPWGQVYQVTDLGTLVPNGLNDKGSLVGAMGGHASRWRAGQAPEDLGFGGVALGIVPSDMAVGFLGGVRHLYDGVVWSEAGWPDTLVSQPSPAGSAADGQLAIVLGASGYPGPLLRGSRYQALDDLRASPEWTYCIRLAG